MSEVATETVLERKAQAQRRALGAGAVSVPRALGRSLSIAADALWGLSATCKAEREEVIPTDRALSRMPDDMLYLLLDKEDASPALLAIDRHLVTGLIEMQTVGKVTQFPLDTRPFTATDAAMTAPLVDAALPRFSSMLVAQPEQSHKQNYVFGAHVEDAQTAGLALEAELVHVMRFTVGLSRDTRVGQAVFLFPEPQKQPEHALPPQKGKHEDTMKLVPARMHAVLTRIHVPLSKAQALKPGDILEISPNALNSASLIVDGGHIAAKGKLGQMNGFRAVRIGDGPKTLLQPPAAEPVTQVTPTPPAAPVEHAPPGPVPDTAHPSFPPDMVNVDSLSAEFGDPAELLQSD